MDPQPTNQPKTLKTIEETGVYIEMDETAKFLSITHVA
jgi:hypothetical protein